LHGELTQSGTERKKSANFGREDGASRPVRRHIGAPARTTNGLNTQSVFARRNVVVHDVA
jgi:hypothetical protein